MATSPAASQNAPSQKPQKQMTKAERREMQEKQRAAKAASKSAPEKKAKEPTKGKERETPASRPQASRQRAPSTSRVPSQNTSTRGEELSQQPSHGTRIFSHFLSSKRPFGSSAVSSSGAPKLGSIKGDIHPAIISLAVQYAHFKIAGANARCIAMLVAFKAVSLLGRLCFSGRSFFLTSL